jgi:hypothetical protein
MGYMLAMGPCICCKRMFSFNPELVPSSDAITGQREPVCETCMFRINQTRAEMGLPPHPILPGAYEPQPENE